jgi:hypothetical protein
MAEMGGGDVVIVGVDAQRVAWPGSLTPRHPLAWDEVNL